MDCKPVMDNNIFASTLVSGLKRLGKKIRKESLVTGHPGEKQAWVVSEDVINEMALKAQSKHHVADEEQEHSLFGQHSPSRWLRERYLSPSSSRITGKEIFSTTTHCGQLRGVTWKISCKVREVHKLKHKGDRAQNVRFIFWLYSQSLGQGISWIHSQENSGLCGRWGLRPGHNENTMGLCKGQVI